MLVEEKEDREGSGGSGRWEKGEGKREERGGEERREGRQGRRTYVLCYVMSSALSLSLSPSTVTR